MILAPATIPTIPGLQAALDAKAPTANPAFTGAFQAAAGTLTDPAPNQITQTWNDAADTFTAFQVNVTDTASASGSKLADLQVGGVSKFNVTKDGILEVPNTGALRFFNGNGNGIVIGNFGSYGIGCGVDTVLSWGSGLAGNDARDTGIARAAAGVVEVNNAVAGNHRDLRLRSLLDTNGDQVVTTRGAIVADATDAASAITQLNALLARVRAHGLIAN